MLHQENNEKGIITETLHSKLEQLAHSMMALDCVLQPLALLPGELSHTGRVLLSDTHDLLQRFIQSRQKRHHLQSYMLFETEELMDFIINHIPIES